MTDNELEYDGVIANLNAMLDDLNAGFGTNTIEAALDLINRQRAEINILNFELKAMRGEANGYKAELKKLKQLNSVLETDIINANMNLEHITAEYEQITKKNAAVSHPSHYCDGGIETIDYIHAKMSRTEFIGYCKGNALKYISRAGEKAENSLKQDLSKAITYLEWARDAAEESEARGE